MLSKIKIRNLINQEIEAIKNIPITDDFKNVVNLIYEQIHLKKGKLIVSGIGKAGQVGHNIATTLSSTGTPSLFLHPCEAQHGDLGVVQENDLLLLISNSGKTREILELVTLSKKLYLDIKIISISGNIDNELSKISDISLTTSNPKEICPLNLTPTTSTTTMTVVGDIIVVMLMDKINFTREDYAKRHHGGYLGQLAKSR